MLTPQQIQQAIQRVSDQPSFIHTLLRETLGWEIPQEVGEVEEIAYAWSADELNAEGLDEKIVDGQVWQIQPLSPDIAQPWGIFVLDFKHEDAFVGGRGLTGPLRKVLRGLVPKRRRQSNLPAWNRENLLFICTHNYQHFRFAYFKPAKQRGQAEPLAMFGWDSGDAALRTLCEYNLPCLAWSDDAQQSQWREAFNIEKVTKGFYSQVARLFADLVGGSRKQGSKTYQGKNLLKLPACPDDTTRKEFAVRLIGRVVFCWFLKKKKSQNGVPLLPQELLCAESIKNTSIGGYYHSILEPLFFEVLNTPQNERKTQFEKGPWSIIPFLNGGLFTPHEDDFYKLTFNGISEHLNDLTIPDDWIRELFEVFETFNFTIEESTPLDIEVAVDPEILGRIFENLLAEINPETGETARRATGSYYTPRPIVEYMVDASLTQYLSVKTALPEQMLARLLSYGTDEISLSEEQRDIVIAALHEVKVIDPACGSGAFPMGILQKILVILQKVDPDSQKWLSRILAGVKDTTVVQELKRRIDQPTYLHKLGIIKDCIYGADIQPIAVEISKLRFFLCLIVDEAVDDSRVNRGVEPLPNLEFKFVSANTLIGLHGDMLATNETIRKIEELKEVREEYLDSYAKEKKDLEKKFLAIRSELSRLALNWQEGSEVALQLAAWNPFAYESCGWFDPGWMFGTDGFDIVIGNPPYLEARSPQFTDSMKEAFRQAFAHRWPGCPALPRGSDLLVYFVELGVSIVGEVGHIVLLTQNSWLDTEYGMKLQQFLLKNTEVKAIIDSDYKYFDSKSGPNINTVIVVLQGKRASRATKVRFVRCHDTFEHQPLSVTAMENSFSSNAVDCSVYSGNDRSLENIKWGILLAGDSHILEVLAVLQEKGKLYTEITDIDVKIGQGLNLSSEHFVSSEFLSEFSSLRKARIPIMTNSDGAVFDLTSTGQCLLNSSELSSDQKDLLANKGIKTFDPRATSKERPVLILPRGVSRHFCTFNSIRAFSASYVDIYAANGKRAEEVIWNLWLFLNSSVLWLLREIAGRKNLGGGLLKAEAIDLKSLPVYLDLKQADRIKGIFARLREREALPTLAELETDEHRKIDRIVFDYLDLKTSQRQAILQSLAQTIAARAEKSRT